MSDATRPIPRVRVGVRDVARVAGVSPQTVSRVLNGHPSIRDDTRARVLSAVDALGYRMNNVARALGTSTTRTVGVIASDAALYGPSVGITALAAAARSAGLWIATAYANADDGASLDAAVQHLLSQGVDGIVVVAAHVQTFARLIAAEPGVAIVALNGSDGSERQAAAAALPVRHLRALGHRRIAEVAGPEEWLEAGARSTGVARALEEAGLRSAGRWMGDWTAASGAALAGAVAEAVGRHDGPTAVVVANDQMALGLIAGLRARGVDVPGRVSVAGFDDNPDAAYYHPALTTVRLDQVGEARLAVARIVGTASDSAFPEPPVLVARASTASPSG